MSTCIKTTDGETRIHIRRLKSKSRKTLFRDFKVASKYMIFAYYFNRYAIKTKLRYTITKPIRRFKYYSYDDVSIYGAFETYIRTDDIPRLSNM